MIMAYILFPHDFATCLFVDLICGRYSDYMM